MSWIYPSGKLRKKGCQPILVRVIEYTIEHPDNPEEELTYRLITSLLDVERFPAELLAREYHQRWEVENTIDELKIHHKKAKNSCPFPKTKGSGARGLCLVVRTLVSKGVNVSNSNRCWGSTITLEFYGDITSYPSCPSKVSTSQNRRIAPFFHWLTVEILDTLLPIREHRNNPRVVKKPVSKFRSKKPKHRGTGKRVQAPKFHITNQHFRLN